jgi:hypothetical protein
MKHLYLLLTIVFLCQSCYTYRKVDMNKDDLTVGKKYKIRLKKECLRVDLVAVNDSSLIVLQYNKDRVIKRAEISEIESGEFSVLKTIGYPLAGLALFAGVMTGLFILTY